MNTANKLDTNSVEHSNDRSHFWARGDLKIRTECDVAMPRGVYAHSSVGIAREGWWQVDELAQTQHNPTLYVNKICSS